MTVTDRAAATEAEFRSRIARFESAVTPPEVVEARVVEEVAQAIRDSNGTPEALAAWRRHPQLIPAEIYAAAAVAAVRAAQDGGAEEADDRYDLATDLANQGLRSCCGQPSAEHCR